MKRTLKKRKKERVSVSSTTPRVVKKRRRRRRNIKSRSKLEWKREIRAIGYPFHKELFHILRSTVHSLDRRCKKRDRERTRRSSSLSITGATMPGESIPLTPDLPGASSLVLRELTYCFVLTSSAVTIYLPLSLSLSSQHPRLRVQSFLPKILRFSLNNSFIHGLTFRGRRLDDSNVRIFLLFCLSSILISSWLPVFHVEKRETEPRRAVAIPSTVFRETEREYQSNYYGNLVLVTGSGTGSRHNAAFRNPSIETRVNTDHGCVSFSFRGDRARVYGTLTRLLLASMMLDRWEIGPSCFIEKPGFLPGRRIILRYTYHSYNYDNCLLLSGFLPFLFPTNFRTIFNESMEGKWYFSEVAQCGGTSRCEPPSIPLSVS